MPTCEVMRTLATPSDSYAVHEEEAVSHSFATPFTQPVRQFIQNCLGKMFPKKQPVTTTPPSVISEEEAPTSASWNTLDFDTLVEEACLKIWGMLRAHLKQINQYHEEQEKLYKAAIKEQVKSYLSWVGTALQVASIGTGICTIGFSLLPAQMTALCKNTAQFFNFFHFEWYNSLLKSAAFNSEEFSKAALTALPSVQGIFTSCSTIHNNYKEADLTSAKSSSEISRLRMDKISKEEETESGHRDSLLRTIEEQYRQEAEARKAISR